MTKFLYSSSLEKHMAVYMDNVKIQERNDARQLLENKIVKEGELMNLSSYEINNKLENLSISNRLMEQGPKEEEPTPKEPTPKEPTPKEPILEEKPENINVESSIKNKKIGSKFSQLGLITPEMIASTKLKPSQLIPHYKKNQLSPFQIELDKKIKKMKILKQYKDIAKASKEEGEISKIEPLKELKYQNDNLISQNIKKENDALQLKIFNNPQLRSFLSRKLKFETDNNAKKETLILLILDKKDKNISIEDIIDSIKNQTEQNKKKKNKKKANKV